MFDIPTLIGMISWHFLPLYLKSLSGAFLGLSIYFWLRCRRITKRYGKNSYKTHRFSIPNSMCFSNTHHISLLDQFIQLLSKSCGNCPNALHTKQNILLHRTCPGSKVQARRIGDCQKVLFDRAAVHALLKIHKTTNAQNVCARNTRVCKFERQTDSCAKTLTEQLGHLKAVVSSIRFKVVLKRPL